MSGQTHASKEVAQNGPRPTLPGREFLSFIAPRARGLFASDKTGPAGGGGALASLAAIISILAASSCCLPVLPFMLAAGLAGGSAFLSTIRPYLLAASVLFIALGFYQGHRSRKCQRRPGVVSSLLLWVSAGFVLVSVFFPQAMANAAANLLTR